MENALRLSKFCNKLATLVALLTVIGGPGMFYLFTYNLEISGIESEIEVTTSLLNQYVRRNPELWKYDHETLFDILRSREGDEQDDYAAIILPSQKILIEHEYEIEGPTIELSDDLTAEDQLVGRLLIRRPLVPVLQKTFWVGVFSAILSIVLFIILKTVPLRAVIRAEKSLHSTNDFLKKVMEGTTNAIFVVDLEGNIQMANNQSASLCAQPLENILKTRFKDLFSEKNYGSIESSITHTFTAREPAHDIETFIKRPDGSEITITGGVAPIMNDDEIISTIWTFDDITAQRIAEEEVQKLAYYDPLTGLPNRTLLKDRLEQDLNRAERNKHLTAVLFLDLDRFKNINDTLGHEIGDQLLVEISKNLQSCLRETDTIARYGGDEFVIVLPNLPSNHEEYITLVARKVLAATEQPIQIRGKHLFTSCSIGISVFPFDGHDSTNLLKNADLAMYQAKEKGRKNFQFFSAEIYNLIREKMQLENNLNNALSQKQIYLNYQPVLEINKGETSYIEVLARWQHPQKGQIEPEKFIHVAEETGIIIPLGYWIIKAAFLQYLTWQKANLNPPPLAINISIQQLNQPDFVSQLTSIMDKTGFLPENLELELTESGLMENSEELLEKLHAIKKLGIRIAIDDFGTGYSSLSYLKHYPIDRLKIDRCFVSEIASNQNDSKISQTIIAMGKSLGLKVTAEGVEGVEQLNILRQYGCDEIQGYLFSRPLSAEDMRDFLTNGTASEQLVSV